MELKIGVTNPYAIAELVAGKKIRWSSLADPVAELSTILQIPSTQIFAADSPLLRPGMTTDAAGNLKVLSPEESHARLQTFLRSNLPDVAGAHPLGLKVLTPKRAQLLTSLLAPERVASSSQPWQPADIEWTDKGDFFEDLAEINDPIQGGLGDCYYIAALSSVTWSRPYAIANVVRPSAWGNDENPIHRVVFYKDGTGNGEAVEVSERVPVQKNSLAWRFARSLDTAEIWPAVMEKAFAKWRTANTTDFPDYGPIAGGDPVLSCAQLVRGTRQYKGNSDHSADALIQFVRGNSLGARTFNPMVAWTYDKAPAGLDYGATRVVGNHAYSILGWAWANNTYYIVLRNPWGTHEANVDVLAGNWVSSNVYSASMPLNTAGVFAMKVATFKKYFAGMGWVV